VRGARCGAPQKRRENSPETALNRRNEVHGIRLE
jgi:hypothetical protein